jgi:hypothetical protein
MRHPFRFVALAAERFAPLFAQSDRELAGTELADVVDRLLANPEVSYLHVHNAAPGCFNCSVRRV